MKHHFIGIWLPVVFLLLACQIAAQDNKKPNSLSADSKYKIRRIFVPENELQKVIKGRFLPMKLEDLTEYLDSTQVKAADVTFKILNLDLEWNPIRGIAGKSVIELDNEIAGKSATFVSDLVFSKLKRLDGSFGFQTIGENLAGFQTLTATGGKRFESDVSVPGSGGSEFQNVIRLPAAQKTIVRIALPVGYQILGLNSEKLHYCVRPGQQSSIKYRIELVNPQLRLRIVRRGDLPDRVVMTRDELTLSKRNLTWRSEFELPPGLLTRNQNSFWVDSRFEVRSVKVGGRDIEHKLGEQLDGKNRIQIEDSQLGNELNRYVVELDTPCSTGTLIEFSPLEFESAGGVRSDTRLMLSPAWQMGQISLNGFDILERDRQRGIRFVQFKNRSRLSFNVVRRVSKPKTSSLEVDFVNGVVVVRQLIQNLDTGAVLRINDGWEFQTVVDTLQDELPIPFASRNTNSGSRLELFNEAETVRITAKRDVNTVDEYRLKDFVPVDADTGSAEVLLASGFLARFGDGLESPSGIADPNKQNSQEWFAFDQLESFRFRLTADSRQFQTKFKTVVGTDLGKSNSGVEYEVTWDTKTGNRLMMELEGDRLDNVDFSGLPGTHSRLSDPEKQRLGLPVTRSIWSFEVLGSENDQARVAFTLPRSVQENVIDLKLPRPIGSTGSEGILRIKSDLPNAYRVLDRSILEIPENEKPGQRTFQYSGQASIKVALAGRRAESLDSDAEFQVLESRMEILDGKNFIQHNRLIMKPFLGSDSSDFILTVQLKGAEIKRAICRVDNHQVMGFPDKDNRAVWTIKVPHHNVDMLEAALEISATQDGGFGANTLQVPLLHLNGKAVYRSTEISINDDLVIVDLNKVFASSLVENITNVLWLPSLGFDTETIEHIVPVNQAKTETNLQPGEAGSWVFVLPQKVVMVLALVTLGIFIFVALALKRNRYALYGTLFFLSMAFLFGGHLGFVASLAFWGFAIGLLLRELKRLCSFATPRIPNSQAREPSGSQITIAFFICLVCLQSTGSCQEKKQGPISPEKDAAAKVVPAFIPLDKDNKPIGIAYLPAEVYRDLTTAKTSGQDLIFESLELQISEDTTTSGIKFRMKFQVVVRQSGKINLPFHVKGGIYDTEAVKVDNLATEFTPNPTRKLVEVDMARDGQHLVEIEAQVAARTNSATEIRLPVSAGVLVENLSADSYIISTGSEAPPIELGSGENQLIPSKGLFNLKEKDSSLEELTVVEVFDFSTKPVKRMVYVKRVGPFGDPVLFSLSTKSKSIVQQIPVVRRGSGFAADARGKEKARLDFDEDIELEPGQLELTLFDSKSHRVGDHFLAIQGVDSFKILSDQPLLDQELGQGWENQWPELYSRLDGSFDAVYKVNDLQKAKFWIHEKVARLNCLSSHHFFVSGTAVELNAEFDLSAETPATAMTFKGTKGLEKIDFRMGSEPLEWLKVSEDEIIVFLDLKQPGRYLVELNATFPVRNNDIELTAPVPQVESEQGQSFVWTNRERRIVPASSLELQESRIRQRFVFVGSTTEKKIRLKTVANELLGKCQIREEVKFVPGNTNHILSVDLSEYKRGQWLGVELPPNAKLTTTERKLIEQKHSGQIVRSDSLGRFQVWIPVKNEQESQLEIEYAVSLEANRLPFSGIVNSQFTERMVVLPTQINGNNLRWFFEDAELDQSDSERVYWRVRGKRPEGRYEMQVGETRSQKILFGESFYDAQSQKLRTRYFVQPGDVGQLVIQLPPGNLVESVKVCGRSRSWELTKQSQQITVPLLNNRFHQIVDISTYPRNESVEGEIRLDIPRVVQADCPIYFQTNASQSVAEQIAASWDECEEARNEFIGTAINSYELDLEGAQAWKEVLLMIIESIGREESLPDDLKKRLASLSAETGDADRELMNGSSSPVCNPNFAIYRLSSISVSLADSREPVRLDAQLRILGVILGVGFLALVTGRLPLWVRTPLFSFLLTSVIWVFGVAWISITPESIFAWCWLLFSCLFAFLVVIDAVLKIRGLKTRGLVSASVSDGGGRSTQMDESRPTV